MEAAMNKYLITFAAAAAIAGFASQARAEDGDARDAAMALCNTQANKQFPGDSTESQANRIEVYKACMVAAGFRP
jgi:hypothetical protein